MKIEPKRYTVWNSDKWILWAFSWWYVDNIPDSLMSEIYSNDLWNVRLDWKAIAIRPWFAVFKTLTAWSTPKGIWSYISYTIYQSAYLTCWPATTNLLLWRAINNWSFIITIDWTLRNVFWLDFTSAIDINNIALIIQNWIRLATWWLETCIYDWFEFIISSVNDSEKSAISVLWTYWSWTDISWAGWNPFMNWNTWNWTVTDKQPISQTDYLVIRHNQNTNKKLVLSDTDWNITEINTSTFLTWDQKMNFINIWNVVYTMNWYNKLCKLSWQTYTEVTTWLVYPLRPSFWTLFNWQLFLWWFNALQWTLTPNQVIISKQKDFDTYLVDWSILDLKFSETINWMACNNEALFYFTANTINTTWMSDINSASWVYTYVYRQLQAKEWAMNNDCIVEAWNEIYFLSSSNAINRIAKWQNIYWFEVQEISQRANSWINNIMETLDKDQTWAFGYYLPDNNLIKRFLRSKWSTINDICIIYDMVKDKFLKDNNKYFFDAVLFKGQYYAVSQINSNILLDEFWQTDWWNPIQFRYATKNIYITDLPDIKKTFWETRLLCDLNRLAVLKQEIYIDWKLYDTKEFSYYTIWDNDKQTRDNDNTTREQDGYNLIPWLLFWEEPIWEIDIWEWEIIDIVNTYEEKTIMRTKWNMNVKGNKIKFIYTCSTLWAKVRLKNLDLLYTVLPAIATNLTT